MTVSSAVAESTWFPEVDGWTMDEYERIYHSGDLWELINGAAEGFLNYGFESLHLAEYTRNDEIIRVEIYSQGSTENAYGMYSAERMPDYRQVKIGAQGYSSEGIVNFFTGPYYVKIMAVGLANVEESKIFEMAVLVDKHLDQPSRMPAVLSLLPEEGREYLSDQYIATNFMGYGFLHSAFTARYNKNGSFQLFIIRSSTEEIRKMLDLYKEMLTEERVHQKDDLYILNDTYNGTVFLAEKDEYLIGILDTEEEHTAVEYINAVIARLP
ncbi:MAG: hypothetical protein JXB19_10665 [Bacteroidales bacterium]|nr:hypothetical protein [Bacteroidales bacterium]